MWVVDRLIARRSAKEEVELFIAFEDESSFYVECEKGISFPFIFTCTKSTEYMWPNGRFWARWQNLEI